MMLHLILTEVFTTFQIVQSRKVALQGQEVWMLVSSLKTCSAQQTPYSVLQMANTIEKLKILTHYLSFKYFCYDCIVNFWH